MAFWFKRRDKQPQRGSPPAFRPLRVVRRGMCCAIGHHARAATAAINARINHFRETEFVGPGGRAIMGGALYEVQAWGAERLARMAQAVVGECLCAAPTVAREQVALLMLATESERPGVSLATRDEILGDLVRDHSLHPVFAHRPWGKAGVARVLEDACRMLAGRDGPTHVLVVGVDSLLDAPAIETLLAAGRIATTANPDGLIPAEGAAALLLSPLDTGEPALWVEAVAETEDPWRIGGEVPMRAVGLTQAMRLAAERAGTMIADLDFHASGITGESWYAKEANLAISRAIESKKASFPHFAVAQYTGETGAASPLLTLAWLADAMGRQHDGPGWAGLLHFADEYGRRCAMILRRRGNQA